MAVPKKRLILLIIFIAVAIALIVISMSKLWVENNFTYGWYPGFSKFQRFITGSVPFSIGDIIYILVSAWIIYKLTKNIYLLFKKNLTTRIAFRKLIKFLLVMVCVYVIFLVFWGLNYSRKGISYQLELKKPQYDTADLVHLQSYLLQKVNSAKERALLSDPVYPPDSKIFKRSVIAYHQAQDSFPFLKYEIPSIKASLLGNIGNYLGFTGYYNPFTGEAQINTTVPDFLIPSITVHEMAHQIGYAKENEANFVAFLVGTHCQDALFEYSSYLDLFMYTNAQVKYFDSTSGNIALSYLRPEIKSDIAEWRRFNLAHRSFVEPVIHWIYGKYLKLNKQPQGIRSYDAVVSLVIAYYKKEGVI